MGILNKEFEIVQNKALGAGLLFKFCTGYMESHITNNPIPLPLLYLVLPIVLHEETEKIIASTQMISGLRMAANKFLESKTAKNDLLLAINQRSVLMRDLTTRSLSIALAYKLLAMNVSSAHVMPFGIKIPDSKIPKSVLSLYKSSYKLGNWFSSLTLQEIAVTLKVVF
ncbi:three component ABC system middle component [Xanthocytophaga flava]|uniref:three component ABC system middle component n=1 Tax=Xanthocytophaga flava TaxID=3048013 RepID=UPI0028D8D21F|nr:three component ABC system middle component [Xanthocytophaga flavus]MDJ1473547.1 DUF6521 family protein [Xanthocytophaga flavus]